MLSHDLGYGPLAVSCCVARGAPTLHNGATQFKLFQPHTPLSSTFGSQIWAASLAKDGVGRIANASNSSSCIPVSKARGDVSCMGAQLESAVVGSESDEVDGSSTKPSSSKCVLVAGATGGVGQLVTAALLDRGIQVRALLRDAEKGLTFFGDYGADKFQVCTGDTRQPDSLDPSLFESVSHVVCCTGTTAFPSKRWIGDNTPEQTDWHGVRNLIAAVPPTVQKFILVSSVGVTRYDKLPWSIMNLFGVLKFKKMGEDYLRASGIPYTIIRPGRLTDGPYTSYDLNTLLKATAGNRRAVIVDQGDKLAGEVSRIVVAEACIQALDLACTSGQTYEINSIEGQGPGKDVNTWENLFKKAHSS